MFLGQGCLRQGSRRTLSSLFRKTLVYGLAMWVVIILNVRSFLSNGKRGNTNNVVHKNIRSLLGIEMVDVSLT